MYTLIQNILSEETRCAKQWNIFLPRLLMASSNNEYVGENDTKFLFRNYKNRLIVLFSLVASNKHSNQISGKRMCFESIPVSRLMHLANAYLITLNMIILIFPVNPLTNSKNVKIWNTLN